MISPVAVAVVGGGRVGLSLARALATAGHRVTVCSRAVRPLPPPLDPAVTCWAAAISAADVVVLAVPDDQIPAVASRIAASGAVRSAHVVVHTSGRHDQTALEPLTATGAALGSWHPLQTLVDPLGAPEALDAAPAVLEGSPRAVVAVRTLAASIGMAPMVEIDGSAKPAYHAAAVFASSYLLVLADVAGRLGTQAGLPGGATLFVPLMARTLANLGTTAPAAALTGPVRRGDAGTVQAHLDALTGDMRTLYVALAREAVRLGAEAGADVGELRRVLDNEQRTANGEQGSAISERRSAISAQETEE